MPRHSLQATGFGGAVAGIQTNGQSVPSIRGHRQGVSLPPKARSFTGSGRALLLGNGSLVDATHAIRPSPLRPTRNERYTCARRKARMH